REALDHLPQQIRARRLQRLLEPRARNRHNVTCGHFVLLRLVDSNSKDHEVAVSGHADTPATGQISHSRISYPIHHSRGRELRPERGILKAAAAYLEPSTSPAARRARALLLQQIPAAGR